MAKSNIADADIMDAIERAIDRGDTDLWEGGVPAHVVADDLGRAKDNLKRRLRALTEDGALVEVWGGVPGTGRPRRSYLPPDHPYTELAHERE